jgi:Ca2+-binding RTX toxin-like protein
LHLLLDESLGQETKGMKHPSVLVWVSVFSMAAACGGGDGHVDEDDDGSFIVGRRAPDLRHDSDAPPHAELRAQWFSDPCETPDQPPPGYKLVKGDDSDNLVDLSDKKGNHMIVSGAGNDTIHAGPGDDIVCAGGGEDVVYGGAGNDYIDGGFGNDELHGNNGHDTIHGRGGSDEIFGDGGWDRLFGDLLDDRIWGGAGNDLIVGGHGTDFMHGGIGDDWLRGDTNGDQFVGGAGDDVASFTTTTPPGQSGFGPNPPPGIDADLALVAGQKCKGKNPNNLDDQEFNYPGCSWGDGRDGLMGIETVIGSSFDDRFIGGPGKSTFYGGYGNDSFAELEAWDEVDGGPGSDLCNGSACDGPDEPTAAAPIVFVNADAIDLGVVFLGGEGNDNVSFERNGGNVRVTEHNGQPLAIGDWCHHVDASNPSVVDCEVHNTVTYLLAWGGGGHDTLTVANGFSRDFTAYLDGGPGDDVLNGSDSPDCMFAGESGCDKLYGNGGDDALITESTDGDLLSGGPGNDQLVTNYPCGHHHYQGGPGEDIAGFARVGTNYRVWAQLGGDAKDASPFHGRAYSPGTCGDDSNRWTILDPGLEILEGGSLDDRLFGNDGPNIIWGREGDDEIRGYGGGDVVEGGPGHDELYGGAGQDIIRGGSGWDWIYAQDGTPDHLLTCGGDGGKLVSADPFDPAASGCN